MTLKILVSDLYWWSQRGPEPTQFILVWVGTLQKEMVRGPSEIMREFQASISTHSRTKITFDFIPFGDLWVFFILSRSFTNMGLTSSLSNRSSRKGRKTLIMIADNDMNYNIASNSMILTKSLTFRILWEREWFLCLGRARLSVS